MNAPSASIRLKRATPNQVKFACRNFHYAKVVPNATLAFACYEAGRFIGVITYSPGVNPFYGHEFGLVNGQIYELSRVALSDHRLPTTQYVAISLKLLKRAKPLAQAVISYADKGEQNHDGIIYQAGNWLYLGTISAPQPVINGVVKHSRMVNRNPAAYQGKIERYTNGLKKKYLYPLSKHLRQKLKSKAVSSHETEGGAVPTLAHHKA